MRFLIRLTAEKLIFISFILFYPSVNFSQTVKITPLSDAINTEFDELAPVISPDGKSLFFCREGHPENVGVKTKNTKNIPILPDDQDIWVSRMTRNGKWGKPEHIKAIFNSVKYDFPIGTSADGNTLYIGNQYGQNGSVVPGVSKTRLMGQSWNHPVPLRIKNYYNNANLVNYAMGADERTLILNLEREDSVGKMDIYVSFLQNDNSWSEPLNLGSTVNSGYKEVTPFIASDNKTLYFASNRPGGQGKFDMYMSRRLDDSWLKWSSPVNLGPGINTPGNDISYVIAPSGEYAIFSSDTKSKGKDLYMVTLPKNLRPEKAMIISGRVVNERKNGIQARVVYERLRDGAQLGTTDTSEDGEFKITLPHGEKYGVHAEAEKRIPQSITIDLSGKNHPQEKEVELVLASLQKGATIKLNNIFFKSKSFKLSADSYAELDRLTALLKSNVGMKIEIGGHTDSIGTKSSNVSLSKNRANAVRDYVLEKGIDKSRVTAKGYGPDKPLASNKTSAGRKKNRRVEFKIISTEP